MKFAIVLLDSETYYRDGTIDKSCWTIESNEAKTWPDRSVPDGIIAYWNKVHYERTENPGTQKERVIHSAICGKKVLNNAKVIDLL